MCLCVCVRVRVSKNLRAQRVIASAVGGLLRGVVLDNGELRMFGYVHNGIGDAPTNRTYQRGVPPTSVELGLADADVLLPYANDGVACAAERFGADCTCRVAAPRAFIDCFGEQPCTQSVLGFVDCIDGRLVRASTPRPCWARVTIVATESAHADRRARHARAAAGAHRRLAHGPGLDGPRRL